MISDEFNSKVTDLGLNDDLNHLNEIKIQLVDIKKRLKELEKIGVFDDAALQERLSLYSLQANLTPTYEEIRQKFAPLYKEVLMEACKEEGYYTIGLMWDPVKAGGGHYTVIKSQKDKDGNTFLTNIEPQNGIPLDFETFVNFLDYPPDSEDTIMRTDNKIFNEDYLDLFEIN